MHTQYHCKSDDRRNAVRTARKDGKPFLNGIDFLEVISADQRTLAVHFIHDLDAVSSAPSLQRENIVITGGERIRDVHVAADLLIADDVLTVTVDQAGDFSPYTLRLVTAADNDAPPPGFDPQLAAVAFSFKIDCPNDFDCADEQDCPPELLSEPEINYLAKDYASFRRLMLDRLTALMPHWRERNPADAGVALVEVLAYVADYLSYQQDAIATEAYLGTARRRVSVRRHARLVDYFMHDGANARVWVQLRVSADVARTDPNNPLLPAGTKLLTDVADLPRRIEEHSSGYVQALASGSEVFETMHAATALFVDHNELHFYTWGESACCLPIGATSATLRGQLLGLQPGDVLVVQEALGPQTGDAADVDPLHRQAVRLVAVDAGAPGSPRRDPLTGQAITEIAWHAEDALRFPLCISGITDADHGATLITDVSVALGNMVLADHGRTIDADQLGVVPRPVLERPDGSIVPPRFRPRLHDGPLTQAAPYPFADEDSDQHLSARAAFAWDMSAVQPAISRLASRLHGSTEPWDAWDVRPIPRDLLNSGALTRQFVVEVEADGAAYLRFGDGVHGARPQANDEFAITYRIGNGARGNVGRGALAHIVSDVVEIERVHNPLPAWGGLEPERIEQVRQRAPVAFRTQQRAVTTADYATFANANPDVQRAAATLRWTGSWRTMFVTVDRLGGAPVEAPFEAALRRDLERYRLAGHDLEVDGPHFAVLEIEMRVCAKPDYFNSHVKAALLELFSRRALPGGRRGMFHPDNFTFGQTVYLSPLVAAAEAVDGVASVQITTFQRQNRPSLAPLQTGELRFGRLEIARLDNDPNFPDRGIFHLVVEGGK